MTPYGWVFAVGILSLVFVVLLAYVIMRGE